MTPTQKRLFQDLGIPIYPALGSGDAYRFIIANLKANGIPKRGKTRKILEANGYIKEVKLKWGVVNHKKQDRELAKFQQGLKGVAVKAVAPHKDDLGVLLVDESFLHEIHRALGKNGHAIIRWHKFEGRLTVNSQGHYKGPDESPEKEALRRYFNGLKKKYGAGTDMYYKKIRLLAQKIKVKYRKRSKDGESLTQLQMNLQCQNLLTAALKKGNKKLARAIGYKGE